MLNSNELACSYPITTPGRYETKQGFTGSRITH